MALPFTDPRQEYGRICPYCKEEMTVNHMNRVYCPEKNGVKNFCKNRFKRLKNNIASRGVFVDNRDREPIKITISNGIRDKRKTIDDVIHESIVKRNIKILESILGEDEHVEINTNLLISKGYEVNCFDSMHDNPAEIPVFKLGQYAMVFVDTERVFITHFKLLDL